MAATYQIDALPLARTDAEARREELKRLMSEIANTLAPYATTPSEKQKCFDVRRGRYDWAVLNALLDIQARSDTPNLIPDLLQLEADRRAPVDTESVYDVSEQEQEIDAQADAVQLKLAREKSDVRLRQIADVAPRMIAAWRSLGAAAARALTPTHKRTA